MIMRVRQNVMRVNAWAVMSNTDLNEGRGNQYVMAYCLNSLDARVHGKGKYIMGTDCPIRPVELYRIDLDGSSLYFPVHSAVIPMERLPSEHEQAVQKAKAAGLTDEDIKKLQRVDIT